jgi:hypothetical protein
MSHYDSVKSTAVAAKTDAGKPASSTTATASADSGKSFWDNMLDIVNPLQHLPVVGTIYRSITGDKMGDFEKVAGDTLYGGPLGFVSSLADLGFEKITGKDFGDTVMGFVGLDHDDNASSNTVLTSNTPKPAATNAAVAMDTSPSMRATGAPAPLLKPLSTARVVSPALSMPMVATVMPKHMTAPQPAIAQTKPGAPQPSTTQPAPSRATATSSPVDISSNTDALLQALARNGVTGDMQTQALDAYRRTMNMNANANPVSLAVH